MLLQAYNPQWATDFARMETALREALGDACVAIEHVGSTAVVGLAAKPIIDIDVVYAVDTSFADVRARLERVGYYHNGDQGIAGRDVFKRRAGLIKHPILDDVAHHLYACRADNAELWRHVSFRDCLRRDAQVRETYAQLKRDIAALAHQDRKAYAALKETMARDFIEDALKRAV